MSLYDEKLLYTESLALKILNFCNVKSFKNNETDVLSVDIITEGNIKIDVQYSQNFSLYGDIRLDLVSCFSNGFNGTSRFLEFLKLEEYFNLSVVKPGKLFSEGYLDYLMILVYNKSFSIEMRPDKVIFLKRSNLLHFLRAPSVIKKAKINNKSNLSDFYGSIFLPVPLNVLIDAGGFELTRENFLSNPNILKEFIV